MMIDWKCPKGHGFQVEESETEFVCPECGIEIERIPTLFTYGSEHAKKLTPLPGTKVLVGREDN